jgi:hypothetical protein
MNPGRIPSLGNTGALARDYGRSSLSVSVTLKTTLPRRS